VTIILQNVTKTVKRLGLNRDVLSAVNAVIPSDRRIALLTPRSEDRQVFIELLAGVTLPTAGRIIRRASVSFPVGYLGGFEPALSIKVNIEHAARLYGVDGRAIVTFMRQVVDFSDVFERPFRELPASKRKQLGYILPYTIPFNIYLLDAEPAKAPVECRSTVRELFIMRAASSGIIVATGSHRFARTYCDMVMVLADGHLRIFDSVEEANVLPLSWWQL